METPKIYVGTYAKYNNSSLDGEWLDLDDYSRKEEFYEACKELHSDETDPEYMFQDHENIPDCFIGESWISEKFWMYLEAMQNVENEEAFNTYVSHFGHNLETGDIDNIIEIFNDAFCGEQSISDFAYDLVQEMISQDDTPCFLVDYFDYDKFEQVDGFIFRNI